MHLQTAIANLYRSVPDCVAVGVVEPASGLLLSIRAFDDRPEEPLVATIERMYAEARVLAHVRGKRSGAWEAVARSETRLHVFQRCAASEDLVIVTVCRASADAATTLDAARAGLVGVCAAAA